MRHGFPRNDETYLLVTAGAFSWGHGHADRGAWILYAKGAPLMIDFAAMYTPSLRETWVHPGGISFNHIETVRPCPGKEKTGCYFKGNVWRDHEREPFTCLQWGLDPEAETYEESLGEVTSFVTLPAADFAVMQRPVRQLFKVPYFLPETHGFLETSDAVSYPKRLKKPFTWRRRYLFVKSKDPLSHNYLVIRDDLSGNTELQPALNLWCLADKLNVEGPLVEYTGQHGVDVDCYIAEPSSFNHVTRRLGHTCGFAFSKHYAATFGKPFEEYQIHCQIPQHPGKGGYYVAMVPRKRGERKPTFTTKLGGNAIEIAFARRRDLVVLLNERDRIKLGTLELSGTAFIVKKTGPTLSVSVLAPGHVKNDGTILLDKPGTVEVSIDP